MPDPASLTRALDEAVAAVADAIEVHYRCATSNAASLEIREALSRAMRWVSEASRIEFDWRRSGQLLASTSETPLPAPARAPESSAGVGLWVPPTSPTH